MSKSVVDSLAEELGDSVTTSFECTQFLDTGFPPLNKIISGDYNKGLPVGRIVECFGPPACGKTAISTAAMASAIRQGGFAMFFDHERSFDINLARDLGLDDSSGRFAHLKTKTLEESFVRAIKTAHKIRTEELIPADAPIIVVFDSLAAMVPQSKMVKELNELTMADSLALAKATSTVLPAMSVHAEELNMLVLILNQVRENPGVSYGDPSRTPGGKAPAFYASVRIKLTAAALVEGTGADKERVGQRITAEIVKTRLTRPFQKTTWDFLYEEVGKFDVIGGMIDHLTELGILEKNGARIQYEGKSYYKSQLVKHIAENELLPDLIKLLPVSDE